MQHISVVKLCHQKNALDIHQRSQNLRHLGSQIGRFLGFSSSLYLLRSEYEDKIGVKHRMTCKDRDRIGFAFVFACMVGKILNTPKLSLMADKAIIRNNIGGLGSLVYIWGKVIASFDTKISENFFLTFEKSDQVLTAKYKTASYI